MISEFSQGGVPAPGSPFNVSTGGYFLQSTGGIAIEPVTGNVWFTAGGAIGELTSAGVPVSGYPFILAHLVPSLFGIALDSSHHVWVPSSNIFVSELNSDGSQVSGSPFGFGNGPSGGMSSIDGAGNIWMPGYYHVDQLSNSGSVIATLSASNTTYSVTVDGSGNVWAPNSTSVTEYIGAAVPVVTPLVAGVINNTLGTRP